MECNRNDSITKNGEILFLGALPGKDASTNPPLTHLST